MGVQLSPVRLLLYNREQLVMPFVKGDKRINRKGRPKSFDAARALAQSIAHEEVTNSKGDTVTVTEAILRQWAASKDPRLQMYFFEVAYGKVPTESKTEISGKDGNELTFKVVYENAVHDSTT
jgi:hypothetical protein